MRKGKIEVKCKICEKCFECYESQNRVFCSRLCKAIFFGPKIAEKKKNGNLIECPICKISKYICPSTLKLNKHGKRYCSRKCRGEAMKVGLAEWGFKKTGMNTAGNPYVRRQIKNVRMTEHRRIMQDHLGRKLEKWEHIHHLNENPKDNRLENLALVSNSDHQKIHKKRS